jgi:hypothetical protein
MRTQTTSRDSILSEADMSKARIEKMGFEKTRTVHFEMRNRHVEAFGYRFKSVQEYKWAQYLKFLERAGVISHWDYEPKQFEATKMRHRKINVYTPDFRIQEKDVIWHEVKTSLRQKDVYRFKWFTADYPDERIVLVLNSQPRHGSKQKRLLDNARKYVDDVIFAGPIFRKVGITGQALEITAFEKATEIQQ